MNVIDLEFILMSAVRPLGEEVFRGKTRYLSVLSEGSSLNGGG